MAIAVSVILAGLVVLAVAWPFFRPVKVEGRRSKVGLAGGPASSVAGLGSELESDYRTGIISKSEYEELSGPDSEPSPSVPETVASSDTAEADVERRVRELRQRKGGNVRLADTNVVPFGQGSRLGAQGGPRKSGVCPKCGRPYKQGDRFCTACGTRLTGGAR